MTTKPRGAAADPSDLLIEIPSGDGWTDAQGARLAALAADPSAKAKRERLAILRAAPDAAAALGDLARQLENNLTRDLGDDLFGDAAFVHCENMRGELGYQAAGAVERLLIDRVMITWLNVYRLEMLSRRVWKTDGVPFTRLEWYDRQASRAHGDHLRALTSLARVRRLQVVIGQVNIAHGDQVNQAAVTGGAQP